MFGMHLCRYALTCIRKYIHVHTCICTYTCIHAYVGTYIQTYIYIYIHTYIHTYTHTNMNQTSIRAYMHTCIHSYIHTYIANTGVSKIEYTATVGGAYTVSVQRARAGGLMGYYYNNMWMVGDVKSEHVDPLIDFDWVLRVCE